MTRVRPSEDGWYRVRVPVRFRDLDPMGHAHHTLPIIYLEEARAAFWRELKGDASMESIDYVMAELTLRFHARTMYPGTVVAALAVSRVGRSSFTTEFEVRDEAGVLLSAGSAVQVAYDYAASSSRALDDAERAVLESWQRAYQEKIMPMAADTTPMTPPSTQPSRTIM